jgi:hypothetical protein
MKLLKPAILGAVLTSAVGVAAYAADPMPAYQANPPQVATQATPPQVATNPGLPYSSTRMPGPKPGPSNWIPSPYAPSETQSNYYSGKGFGPKPN